MQVSNLEQFKNRVFIYLITRSKSVIYVHSFNSILQIYDNHYRFKKIGLPQKSTIPNDRITHRLLKDDQASVIEKFCVVYNEINRFLRMRTL